MLRVRLDDGDTLVEPRGHLDARGDLHGDGDADRALDVGCGEADAGPAAVEDHLPLAPGEPEVVEGVEGDLQVLQRRHVQRGEQDVHVGEVEALQHDVSEGWRRVDDDVVVHARRHLDDLTSEGGRHELGVRRLRRGEKGVHVRLVRHDQGGEGPLIEAALHSQRIADGAGRIHLQGDGHVTGLEVEVEQADGSCVRPRRQRGSEVRGDRGLAAAALGGEDKDDLAAARETVPGLHVAKLLGHRHRALARADECLDVVGEHDLADACPQRLRHRRDLHATPHEHDSEERPTQPVGLGHLGRDGHRHVRAHDDEILVRIALEVLIQLLGSLHDSNVVGQREPESIRVAFGIP